MMIRWLFTMLFVGAALVPGFAQQAAPPANAAETLTQCAQAQPVITQLLDGASARLEVARQSNSAALLRAAVDDIDGALRDVRTQLAPCASVPSADAHAGHGMPHVQKQPGTPGVPPGTAGSAPATVAPAVKPPTGVDPHAGHNMTPPAKPASPVTPAAAKPPTGKPAADPHAGHSMPKPAPTPRQPSAPTPPAEAKPPADPHAGHTTAPSANVAPAVVVDPVCGLKVDPATAPAAAHAGQTYHFCSTQHQQLFQKTPAKYLPKK